MKTIKLFLTLAAGLFLAACSEDNIGEQYEILGLGGDTEAQTELDRWLYDNITGPYNMEVKYRWDRSEVDLTYTLVPVKEEVVRPIMSAVVKGWIKPYEKVTEGTNNEAFVYKLSPKKFMLVGSAKYTGSTIVTGRGRGRPQSGYLPGQRLHQGPRGADLDAEDLPPRVCPHHLAGAALSRGVRESHRRELYDQVDFGFDRSGPSQRLCEQLRLQVPGRGFLRNAGFPLHVRPGVVRRPHHPGERLYAKPENQKTSYDPGAALRTKQSLVETYLKSTWDVELYDSHSKKGLITLVQEAIEEIRADIEDAKNNH